MKCYDSIVKSIVRGVFNRSIVFLGKFLIAFLIYFLLDTNCFLQSKRCTDYYLRWIWGKFPVTILAHVIKCAIPDHNFGQYSLQTMA